MWLRLTGCDVRHLARKQVSQRKGAKKEKTEKNQDAGPKIKGREKKAAKMIIASAFEPEKYF